MKLTLDTEAVVLTVQDSGRMEELPLYSDRAFEIISRQWVRVGWNQKYMYTFTWLDRPIIQLPEDMFRIQEVVYSLRPNVIVETGVAHGGSLVYYAGLCKILGQGRVIGVDIEIRPHNRKALEEHFLYDYITLIEGSSTDPEIVSQVRSLIEPGGEVLVILDSDHTKAHVLAELEAYKDVVTPGSYIVATDGILHDLYDLPRSDEKWAMDNPLEAIREFLSMNPNFKEEIPAWRFNESTLMQNITHWTGAWLKRLI